MPNKRLSMFIYAWSTLFWGLQSGERQGERKRERERGRERVIDGEGEGEGKEIVLFLYGSRYAGQILDMDKMGAIWPYPLIQIA